MKERRANNLLYGQRPKGSGPKMKPYQTLTINRQDLAGLPLDELSALGVEQLHAWRGEGQVIHLETLPDKKGTIAAEADLRRFDFSDFIHFYNQLFDQLGDEVLIELETSGGGRYWRNRSDYQAGKAAKGILKSP